MTNVQAIRPPSEAELVQSAEAKVRTGQDAKLTPDEVAALKARNEARAAAWAMTPDEIKAARETLGLTQWELADALELEGSYGKDTVRNWERGKRPISGPARVALRLMLQGAETQGPKLTKADRTTVLDALEIAAAAGNAVTKRLAETGSAGFADTFVAAERFRKLRAKLEAKS